MELVRALPLVVDRRRQAVFVTFNRPDAANALSRELVGALTELCAELSREIAGGGDIRALVITGAGPSAFSAGADLKERRGVDAGRYARLPGRAQRADERRRRVPAAR